MIDFVLGLSFKQPPEIDHVFDALTKGVAIGCVVVLLLEFYLWRVLRKQKERDDDE